MNQRLCALLICAASLPAADYPRQWFFHAHNCYPEKGVGKDRLDRARRASLSAFEIDLVWSEARQRTVISHEPKLDGAESTLEEYFFEPLEPEFGRLPAGQPGILLLLDFKNDHPGPVREIYALLERLRDRLTTFGEELRWGPLTVMLTGDNAAIAMFERLSPPGQPYLAMGNREPAERKFQENVANYFLEPATPFYRVFNFEWTHIEGVPNNKAEAFTSAERERLRALVDIAHQKGYWVRAWTLNGGGPEPGSSKNFGTREALLDRWRAAREVGMESIATDEYELAGRELLRPNAQADTGPTRGSR